MTKKDLEQLKDLKEEIRLMADDIKNLRSNVVSDSVEGSSPSFPYCKHRIIITGVGMTRHDKMAKQLEASLGRLQDMLLTIETGIEAIDDSQTRTIVRLYFRNGLTQKQIGDELGYVQSAVSMKIKEFVEGLE